MKITRRQLRKLISEAIKPGSKYDMYRSYDVTGDDLDMIKSLRTHEEPEYREQGLEVGRTLGIPLIDNATIQVIGYQDKQMAGNKYHDIAIPPDIVRDILKNWREVIDEKFVVNDDRGNWKYVGNKGLDSLFSRWTHAVGRWYRFVNKDIKAAGLNRWHFGDIKGNHSAALTDALTTALKFI